MRWLLALLVFPGVAFAEPLYITVPGEGWSLRVDAPPMTVARGQVQAPRRFGYMTSSTATGVTISLYSETVGGGSNQECRDTLWAKSVGGPTTKSDIRMSDNDGPLFVTHRSEATLQGVVQRSFNGHAYFVKNGLCMDLHVSHWPMQDGSEKRVDDILHSVAIVE